MECPNAHGRQNVVANITADGLPPRKPHDVVAKRLACGCVVGGAEYEQFLLAVHEIEKETAQRIEQLREIARNKKTAAYKGLIISRGEEHAE